MVKYMVKYTFLSEIITEKNLSSILPHPGNNPSCKMLVLRESSITFMRLDIRSSEEQINGRLKTLKKEVLQKNCLDIAPTPVYPNNI